jgi:integrase/recombinase XerD
VKVFGKGRKERMVPIQKRMISQLRVYLAERGTNVATTHLFVTVDDRPMTLRTFEQGITNIGMKAGVSNVRVSPHTFRHTFAKLYIQNGGDVFSLQRILGHTSLEMVRNYVNLFSTEVFRQHAKFSPMEHMSLEGDELRV